MNYKILVLIDVQNDFIDGALRNEEAIKKVPNIVNKIKNFDGDLIYLTRDTHDSDYLETNEGKKLPVPHCLRNTEGWEINKDVMDAVENSRIPFITRDKYTFGSNEIDADIERWLDNANYDLSADTIEFDICGFCTDICVVSNALILKANFYDWADIKVDSSCCAGVTPESHDAALTTMKMCQIDVY